jgi:DNA-binding transcriptional LysR family regulator
VSKSGLISEPSVAFARNVDWNLVKVFYEIARRGGIGAAARSLNKQQPSISAALKRLESQVGAILCTRTSRGIELTVHGHQLLSACEGMYASVQNMPRAASAARRDISGMVTLRVISNLHLLSKLTSIFEEFHKKYPRIEIKLDVAPWRQVVQSVKKGEVELGIGFEDELDDDYLYVPLIEQVQQIYCGPKHPLFGKDPVLPTMLQAEPFVVTQDEPTPYTRYRDHYDLGRQIGGLADNLLERMWLIQIGMGIGILPKSIVDASSFASVLWPLLPDAEAPVCTIYLMAKAQPVRSAPAQLLLDTALDHLRQSATPARKASKSNLQLQPSAP